MGIYFPTYILFGFRISVQEPSKIAKIITRFYNKLEELGVDHQRDWHRQDQKGVTFFVPSSITPVTHRWGQEVPALAINSLREENPKAVEALESTREDLKDILRTIDIKGKRGVASECGNWKMTFCWNTYDLTTMSVNQLFSMIPVVEVIEGV